MNIKKTFFHYFNSQYVILFANPTIVLVSYFICLSYDLSSMLETNVYLVRHLYFFVFCFIGMLFRVFFNFLCQTKIKISIYYKYDYMDWLTKFTQQNIISSFLGMIMILFLSIPIEGNVMGFIFFPIFIIFIFITMLILIYNTIKIYLIKAKNKS